MNIISNDLENLIYTYNNINEIKHINRLSYNMYKKKRNESIRILRKNIKKYLIKKNKILNKEESYHLKSTWKRYYPLKFRKEAIYLGLKKLLLEDIEKEEIEKILSNKNYSLTEQYNKFIDLLSIEQILINGW